MLNGNATSSSSPSIDVASHGQEHRLSLQRPPPPGDIDPNQSKWNGVSMISQASSDPPRPHGGTNMVLLPTSPFSRSDPPRSVRLTKDVTQREQSSTSGRQAPHKTEDIVAPDPLSTSNARERLCSPVEGTCLPQPQIVDHDHHSGASALLELYTTQSTTSRNASHGAQEVPLSSTGNNNVHQGIALPPQAPNGHSSIQLHTRYYGVIQLRIVRADSHEAKLLIDEASNLHRVWPDYPPWISIAAAM